MLVIIGSILILLSNPPRHFVSAVIGTVLRRNLIIVCLREGGNEMWSYFFALEIALKKIPGNIQRTPSEDSVGFTRNKVIYLD